MPHGVVTILEGGAPCSSAPAGAADGCPARKQRLGCAAQAIDRTRPHPGPLPAGERGGLRSSGERRCGRDSCSCDIGRTRPHPGPLPAGEGEDCVPAVSGVAVAILARAISVALALTPALSRRERGGLRSSGERRCGRDSCSCDIGRTRPHPGPLPAGEGDSDRIYASPL